jgi:16S rRNA (uracil1498-N3)-methyltransferase
MSRRRFYVPRDSIRNDVAALPPDQAHHLRRVLRMSSGDCVEVFSEEGIGFSGTVEIRGSEVLVHLADPILQQKSPLSIIVAAALLKSAKFEWMLQKTTELGVEEVIPLNTRFSEIQIAGNKIEARVERWNRIAQEAAKQCGRISAPRIRQPMNFLELLGNEPAGRPRIVFYEKSRDYWLPDEIHATDKILLCFGPEGGWDGSEVEKAREAGFKIHSLGPLVLRAETAAIAAVAIVQHAAYHKQILNIE